MPTQKSNRKGWLKKFLGSEGATQAERALADLERVLDNAKVQKKATRKARQKGVMESMQSDIANVLSKYVDAPNPELVNEIIATVLSAMLPPSEEPADEETMDEDEEFVINEELMMDDEDEDEDEDEEKGDMRKAYRRNQKQLAIIAKDIREQNEALGGLIELFVDIAKGLNGVRADVTALKAKVNAQPRRVGQSDNGLVHDKTALASMKTASEKVDTFWGEPIISRGGK